jgi:hypothetical protein
MIIWTFEMVEPSKRREKAEIRKAAKSKLEIAKAES